MAVLGDASRGAPIGQNLIHYMWVFCGGRRNLTDNRLASAVVDATVSKTLDPPLFLPPANEVCEGYVFTGVCPSTGGSMSRGVSVQEGSLSRRGGLCPGQGSLSRGGGLYPGEGSLSRGFSIQGCFCMGGLESG